MTNDYNISKYTKQPVLTPTIHIFNLTGIYTTTVCDS